MRVAELQQFIRSLIPPLQASGAKADVIKGLEGVAAGIEICSEISVEAFADFLRRAEEYDRTGIIPVSVKPAPKSRAKKAAVPALTIDEALAHLRNLQERSIADDVTFAIITAEVKTLEPLKKPDLDTVSREFGLPKPKSKAAALQAIDDKIAGYKKTHQRNQF